MASVINRGTEERPLFYGLYKDHYGKWRQVAIPGVHRVDKETARAWIDRKQKAERDPVLRRAAAMYGPLEKRRHRHGLSRKRREYELDSFNGQCGVCQCELSRDKANIDHCHVTNRIRGVLCIKCNTLMGKFHDNPEVIEAFAESVRQYLGKATP